MARELSLGTVAVDAAPVRCPVRSASAAEGRSVAPHVGRRIAGKCGAACRLFTGHGHFIIGEPGWEGPAAGIAQWITQEGARA